MIYLIWREFKTSLICLLLTMPLLSIYWLTKVHSVSIIVVVTINTLILVLLILMPVLINEQNEDNSNGYAILEGLPVTRKEVMASKFLLPSVTAVILYCVNRVIFSLFETSRNYLKIADSLIILTAVFTVCVSGFLYLTILRIGYTRLIQGSAMFTVALTTGMVLLIKVLKYDIQLVFPKFIKLLKTMNAGITVCIGLLIFLLLFLAAVNVQRKD